MTKKLNPGECYEGWCMQRCRTNEQIATGQSIGVGQNWLPSRKLESPGMEENLAPSQTVTIRAYFSHFPYGCDLVLQKREKCWMERFVLRVAKHFLVVSTCVSLALLCIPPTVSSVSPNVNLNGLSPMLLPLVEGQRGPRASCQFHLLPPS